MQRLPLAILLTGLMATVIAISWLSLRDPSGLWARCALIVASVVLAMWAPRKLVRPGIVFAWLISHLIGKAPEFAPIFGNTALLELPMLVVLSWIATAIRLRLSDDAPRLLTLAMAPGLEPRVGLPVDKPRPSRLNEDLQQLRGNVRETLTLIRDLRGSALTQP